jgi:hypothetical protein
MSAKELNVRVGVFEKEGDDETPGFPLALQLVQLALETTMFIRGEAVRRSWIIGFLN